MYKKTKLILFDIGGVLIEYKKAFTTMAKDQNIDLNLFFKHFEENEEKMSVGELHPQDLYTNFSDKNELNLNKKYNFLQSWVKDLNIMFPVLELVKDLNPNYEIGLLSNTYHGLVEELYTSKMLPKVKQKYKFLSCNMGTKKTRCKDIQARK